MKVKRAGFVYSLYKRNLINLWIVAGLLLAMAAAMTVKSANYLMNYLFYRREPDQAALTAFLEPNGLELAEVCAGIAEKWRPRQL